MQRGSSSINYNDFKGTSPEILQHAFFQIKPYATCVSNETLQAVSFVSSLNLTMKHQFCAGSADLAQACPGDSGGPFQCIIGGIQVKLS